MCVKHKLPEPNSLLPQELPKSEPAKHLHSGVIDVSGASSYQWPLDEGENSDK